MKKISILSLLNLFVLSVFAQIPTDSLIAFYPFTGNTENAVNFMHNGINYGAKLTTDRFNNENSAFLFDGIDDYIEIADHIELRPPSITISFWVNLFEIKDVWQVFISKFNQNDSGNGNYNIATKDENTLHSSLHYGNQCIGGDDWERNTLKMNWDLAEWQQVVLTYDDNIRRYYKNGVLLEENSVNAIIENCQGTPLKFGGNVWMSVEPQFFEGKLDDIRIYGRALSISEVEGLFKGESSPITSIIEHGNLISKIFPNPVSNELNIEIENTEKVKIAYSIKNILGNEVIKSSLKNQFDNVKIDLNDLPNGIYCISFFENDGRIIESKSFIKN